MARWHSCNVLQAEKEVRQIWQFSAGGDKFTLAREEARLPNEPLPPKVVSKDWQDFFQPKLNVAWLPSKQVFVRAVQLPKADPTETCSMVELQLEKLSPVPVTQAVWTYEVVPSNLPELQTVIVIIVARHDVEQFLGKLENQGYLADRLELPLLDQIRATRVTEDGLWIYPGVGTDAWTCLVAWWYHGTLQNLGLAHLPAENRAAALQEQLSQVAWAGELEGWLTSPPRHHLVADEATAAEWAPLLAPDRPLEVTHPLPLPDLAQLTARRAAAANGAGVGLMPPEYAARYRQQFIDRLWMRSLGAVLLLYIFGVLVYFAITEVAKWRLGNVQTQITGLAPQYTNVLVMREQVKVLQDQLDMQYSGLDCYQAVAESMPTEFQLESFQFEGGRRLVLHGIAPSGSTAKVQEFYDAIRKFPANNDLLFSKVQPPSIQDGGGGAPLRWNFNCDLKRSDRP